MPWWLWVCGINALVLGAAFAVKSGWTGNKYVRKLAPNWEYTVGNWWSGVLLLLFGCLTASVAMNLARGPRGRGNRGRWAMGCLSVLAVGLCLDEMGSLHERVGEFGPLPNAWNLLPFAALFVVVAGTSLWWVRQNAELFGRAWIKLLLGFLCLGLGEPIDMIEHAYPWPVGLVPVSVVLEEGVELLGSTLLIWGAIEVIHLRKAVGLWDNPSAFVGLAWLGRLLMVIAAPLLVLRHGVMDQQMLGLSNRGDFAAAAVAMMFLLAAWACASRSNSAGSNRGLWKIAGGASVLVSLEIGCNLYAWITRESVRSASSAWWAQVLLIALGYGLLRLACQPITPARPPSQAAAA